MQVILAEDTYSSEARLVVIKVLKRHFGVEGLKVSAYNYCLHQPTQCAEV